MPGRGLWETSIAPAGFTSLAFQSTLLCRESAVEGPEVVEMVKVVAHDARPALKTPGGGISEQMSRDWKGAWAADGANGRELQ